MTDAVGGAPRRDEGDATFASASPTGAAAAESDDARLLQLTAGGDDVAFARFVERHQGGVWRRALALSGQTADAEDLLQETFLAAWRHAASFRGGPSASARAWLLTIAHHAWQRMGRRSVPVIAVAEEESLEALALRAGWGSDDADDDRRATVQEALSRLTPDDRQLLLLRDVEELGGEEVAALLGLSLAAMKSRLHRARLRLAAAYEEVRRASA